MAFYSYLFLVFSVLVFLLLPVLACYSDRFFLVCSVLVVLLPLLLTQQQQQQAAAGEGDLTLVKSRAVSN